MNSLLRSPKRDPRPPQLRINRTRYLLVPTTFALRWVKGAEDFDIIVTFLLGAAVLIAFALSGIAGRG